MKTRGLFALIVVWYSISASGQSYITFGNRIPGLLDAPIYGSEVADGPLSDWANAKSGNTPMGTPAGTQFYKGSLLEGWSVMFLAAPGIHYSARDPEFQPGAVTLTLGTGPDAGYFPTTAVPFYTLFGSPGTTVTVQVRVWDSLGGTVGWSPGNSPLPGASALFTAEIGGVATGFRSFSAGFLDGDTLAPFVPEPGGIPLFGLGALLLFSVRRLRKRGGVSH